MIISCSLSFFIPNEKPHQQKLGEPTISGLIYKRICYKGFSNSVNIFHFNSVNEFPIYTKKTEQVIKPLVQKKECFCV